eukprot:GHVU01157351.1.p1 GENE.GHVU01157351.1~~GHVU01157351.1.p1  ORF type:complete len:184 (-),score=30.64 GHVU01157351.1:112-663(-)
MRLLNAMKRLIASMKNHPSALVMRGVRGAVCLTCYSDAAFKLLELKCRTGYKIFLHGMEEENDFKNNNNIIAWSTKEIKELVDSSTSAELLALKGVIKAVWQYIPIVESMWQEKVKVQFVIDNQPLQWQLVTGETKAEPKMKRHLNYVMQELKSLGASSRWVPREDQVADVMTKCVWFHNGSR